MVDLDTIALWVGKRIPFIGVTDMQSGQSVLQHFFTTYGIVVTGVLVGVPWIVSGVWAGVILYQEFIADGHLKAIWAQSWTEEKRTDFIADMITKFAGFIGLLWV